MSVTLSVTVAGSNVELGRSSLAGQCSEALCPTKTSDWSGVDSKDIFVVDERRGRLVVGMVATSMLLEAFRRTLTTTSSKQTLSVRVKHSDNPPTCLYNGPLNPAANNRTNQMSINYSICGHVITGLQSDIVTDT